MLLVHILLHHTGLDFPIHLAHNTIQVISMLQLQLLVMASALIWRPLLQNLRKPVKHLGFSSLFLSEEIVEVVDHELKVDPVFLRAPPPYADFIFVNLEAQLFDLMIFRLKTLRIRVLFLRNSFFVCFVQIEVVADVREDLFDFVGFRARKEWSAHQILLQLIDRYKDFKSYGFVASQLPPQLLTFITTRENKAPILPQSTLSALFEHFPLIPISNQMDEFPTIPQNHRRPLNHSPIIISSSYIAISHLY